MVPEQPTRPETDSSEHAPDDIEAAMSRALAPVVARAGQGIAALSAAATAPRTASVAAPAAAEPAKASGLAKEAATTEPVATEPAPTADVASNASAAGDPADPPVEAAASDKTDIAAPAETALEVAAESSEPVETAKPTEAEEDWPAPVAKAEPPAKADETADAVAASDADEDEEAEAAIAMPPPTSQAEPVGDTEAQAASVTEPEPAFEPEPSPEAESSPEEDEAETVGDDETTSAEAVVNDAESEDDDAEDEIAEPVMPAVPMVAAGLAVLSRPTDEPMPGLRGPTPAGAYMTQNRIYDHLVEGEDDVIGLITYSLYKQDKRDWLVNWIANHGAEPTEDQLEAFVNAQMTTAQRERYRNAARQVLDAYASVAVDLEKPMIVREAIAGRVEAAAARTEHSARFWRQFGIALLAAVLTAGLVFGVIAILIAAGVDVAGYLGFENASG